MIFENNIARPLKYIVGLYIMCINTIFNIGKIKMQKLFETYAAVYKQGFMPIFVKDDWDTGMLLDACRKAGVKAIEYTLRRQDAHEVIPSLPASCPDMKILVGSVLDSERIIKQLHRNNPQLMTFGQLAGCGVHGFISMFEFSSETISKYSNTHLLVPCAYTPNEAFRMLRDGAHIIKIVEDLSLVRKARAAPSHGFCPFFFTGGMTQARFPEAIDAGAVCIASGFDLMLKGLPKDISSDQVGEIILGHIAAVNTARRKCYPELMAKIDAGAPDWIDFAPHYHFFTNINGV
jgi:2-keto-3-deoxy-6-phosphogluconate aldolase